MTQSQSNRVTKLVVLSAWLAAMLGLASYKATAGQNAVEAVPGFKAGGAASHAVNTGGVIHAANAIPSGQNLKTGPFNQGDLRLATAWQDTKAPGLKINAAVSVIPTKTIAAPVAVKTGANEVVSASVENQASAPREGRASAQTAEISKSKTAVGAWINDKKVAAAAKTNAEDTAADVIDAQAFFDNGTAAEGAATLTALSENPTSPKGSVVASKEASAPALEKSARRPAAEVTGTKNVPMKPAESKISLAPRKVSIFGKAAAVLAALVAVPSSAFASQPAVEQVSVNSSNGYGWGMVIIAIASFITSMIFITGPENRMSIKNLTYNAIATAVLNAVSVVVLVLTAGPGAILTLVLSALAGTAAIAALCAVASSRVSKSTGIIGAVASLGLTVALVPLIFTPVGIFTFVVALNALLLGIGMVRNIG